MHFNKPGTESTGETVRIAIQEAKERQISHVVAASNTGFTAFALAEEARKQGYGGKLICVSHAYGFKENGKNDLADEDREKLEQQGVRVYTASHVLSGAERCLTHRFQGIYPVEIIAHALRMLSHGIKVCVDFRNGPGCGAYPLRKARDCPWRNRRRSGQRFDPHPKPCPLYPGYQNP